MLGNDGLKMSKSLRNYPDVREVFDRDGADAMRWFLMSSPILRGGNLIVTEQGIREGVRQAMLPLWSTWYFFATYAGAYVEDADGSGPKGYDARWSTASTHVLDRYLLARVREVVEEVQTELDAYDIAGACDTVRSFLDVLTNWYVRRSRDRFWDTRGDAAPRAREAMDTLYTTLEVLCRVAAPLLPMTTEEIWRGLTGGRSVHLADYPVADDLPADHDLVARMERARTVTSVAASLRKADGLRTRLPLATLTVVTEDAAGLAEFADLIAAEVNVKEVRLQDLSAANEAAAGVNQRLIVNARAAGPRLGKQVQTVIKGSKSGDWSLGADGTVTCAGIELAEGEYTLETVVDEAHAHAGTVSVLPGGGFIVLDTAVTPELAAEGLAADIVRAVNAQRRSLGLDYGDAISLTVLGDDDLRTVVMDHQAFIESETLARQIGYGPADALPADRGATVELGDGRSVRMVVTKL